ncbi:hypothetical protein BCR33DRAFT_711704 [Rhizoclosmatium globosum]|uniref:CRAL/TRIO N-terminal domain-containing protein n=1 Tax=Rhizoclosmatium globosum TaxID=329046 RepID=A0A1Y2CZC7_9FUNG|nr:hypothetical protein HDU99_003910 [Rhizoclosmatium hyalinum]KAJ3290618.1 hypothetical protein HDU79_003095 [Rhizoclosmatium sp. JEL0117]ORY52379.1 hypothetical protein BCR33DRAFT_711704 [Rhizoclosmatium globosum]|eukprot:ORY52379.1 hypothetical protein BCR33DRAFT_711704 [Rhizoclosmatium globosum]
MTPDQQKRIDDLRAEVPSLISSLRNVTPEESQWLHQWASEERLTEFLEISEWDSWAASFKLKQTLQWRKEFGLQTKMTPAVRGLDYAC